MENIGSRLFLEDQSHHPQIRDGDGARGDCNAQQVPAFEQGKRQNRFANGDADGGLLEPLSKIKKRHGKEQPSFFDETGFSEYTTLSGMSNYIVLVQSKVAMMEF